MSDTPTDPQTLIEQARRGDAAALGRLLDTYRVALKRIAERQLFARLAVRMDASDVVQQTFLEAHRGFGQFEGQSVPELLAWLQRILHHNLLGLIRDHATLQKRDVRREQSLDDSRAAPAGRDLLPGHGSTPSQKVMRYEEEDRLLQAIATLPEDQREAVHLRHLQRLSLTEIAQRLNKTPVAVASLIKRGMQTLRKHFGIEE
jgi:RNA polymerase sigma-70 factor, ECF subfamily